MSEDQAVTGASSPSRRALLLGAGAVGATVALSACGTGSDTDLGDGGTTGQSQPAGGTTSGAPAGGGDTGTTALAKAEEIPVGGGKIFAEQGVVVTQPSEGNFKAFSNICTHQRCPVSSIDGGTINCTCHNSKFSIEDGSVKGGPAPSPLPAKQVKVDGGNIVLA
ncbi:Ferredoxin subunit of nitrite reductase or a ring-hydroxylating dioxygenase [Micromonospora pattaloongensis]|uniref:Cytochrome bc1 complex Rieske iron-sulfur subunit n=1 Tax=Micromonospora pattaloongensis TaxID=405436 RepID=A0A1H3QBE1_9ACTN|nr:Rieske (2Fe-2S) protein [Micromonospora pattaloongensis]SDZ10335.1 Ferredoxin subunit of nitrite reductase or a ring-hydroxylating dioxygenase [Micromonospora pattaloongensis]